MLGDALERLSWFGGRRFESGRSFVTGVLE